MPRKKTHEEFLQDVKNKYGDQYEILGTYDGNKKKIEILHKECNTTFSMSPNEFLRKRGHGCPVCGHKMGGVKIRKSPEEYRKEFYECADGEYELLSDYVSSYEKVKVKHLKCNSEYMIRPLKFTSSGRRCMFCSNRTSKSERAICNKLDEIGIEYVHQKRFDDLRSKNDRQLSYDFYIPSLNMLLEYNGEQHYMPIRFDGMTEDKAKAKFLQQIEKDKQKEDYAKSNNYNFVVIKYDVESIEDELVKIIKEYSLT